MADVTQKIFREKALRRYLDERQQSVLPPWAGRRIFLWLWFAIFLLLAGGVATYLRVQQILTHG